MKITRITATGEEIRFTLDAPVNGEKLRVSMYSPALGEEVEICSLSLTVFGNSFSVCVDFLSVGSLASSLVLG